MATACGGGATTPPPTPTAGSTTAGPTATRTPIVLPSFAQLSAPSSSVLWILVAGSRLFRSTDRGRSWDEHSLASPARNGVISFVSEREGWLAFVDMAGAPCGSEPSAIWHTTDAAATWQRVSATGITSATCNESLSFADAQHGFVGALDQRSGPVIYRTSDGAKTWTMSGPLPDPPGLPMQGGRPDIQLGRVRAFGATLIVPATVAGQAGVASHVYRSQDGGATWTVAASIPSTGTLAIVTASRWLRLGPAANAFETTDAGRTWHAFTSDYSQAAPIAPEIVFADANTGFATVRGGLQRSEDGGAHWTMLKTPGTE